MGSPIVPAALLFIVLCWVQDVRSRRIPNALSGTGMLAGLILNASYFGPPGLIASVVGLVATMVVLLTPFALGGIGAGDVKMMGAVGALLGPTATLTGLGVGMILGGVVMMVHLARLGRLREKLAATGAMFAVAAFTRSLSPLKVSADQEGAIALPYSVPLGLGVIAVLALEGSLPRFS